MVRSTILTILFLLAFTVILGGTQKKSCQILRIPTSDKTSLKCTGFTSIPNPEERRIRIESGSLLPFLPTSSSTSTPSSSSGNTEETFTSLLLNVGNTIKKLENSELQRARFPPTLEYLQMEHCELQEIEMDAFKGLESLDRLSLAHNKIEKLDPNVFKYLKSLSSLYLNGNPLKCFQPGQTFPSLLNLHKLDLGSCFLTHLESTLLENLSNLEELSLGFNSLSTLDWKLLLPLDKLNLNILNDNPWHCDCRLRFLLDFLDQRIAKPRVQTYIDILKCTSGTKAISSPGVTETNNFNVVGAKWKDIRPHQLSCPSYITTIKSQEGRSVFRVGESFNLDCEYSGFPKPNVIWKRNGFIFDSNNNSRIEIVKIKTGNKMGDENYANYTYIYGQRLTIKQVKVEDAGTYQCVASNLNGNATSKEFQVNVSHSHIAPITIKPETSTEITHDGYLIPFPGEREIGDRDGRRLGENETLSSSVEDGEKTQAEEEDWGIPGWLCVLLGIIGFLLIVGLFGGICIWKGRRRENREDAMNAFASSRFARSSYMRKKVTNQPTVNKKLEDNKQAIEIESLQIKRTVDHNAIKSFLSDITEEGDFMDEENVLMEEIVL